LAAQRPYGGDPAIADLGWAALGAAGRSATLFTGSRFAVAASARLTNRDELARQLGRRPAPGDSDAQLIHDCWEKLGEDCAARLLGSFAFVVADLESRSLHLVRDLTGSRPLCFATRDSSIGVSSMPSGLAAARTLEPDLDLLAARLRGQPWPEGATPWKGVRAVPPASILNLAGAQKRLVRHFDPAGVTTLRRPHRELVATMRETIDEAVAREIDGSSPIVACHLSSGLDSSAVATSAARLLRGERPLVAFTSAPMAGAPLNLPHRSRIGDESHLAALTARMAGAEHIVVRDGGRIVESMRGVSRYIQDSAPNPLNFGWWTEIAKQARERGAGSLLIGFAGNATISFGGIRGLAWYLGERRVSRWAREALAVRRHGEARWRGILYASLEPWLPARAESVLRNAAFAERDFATACFARPELDKAPRPATRYAGGDSRLARFELLSGNDQGLRNLGLQAVTGVEERDPTADRRLVEFCMALPPEALLCEGRSKPVLRDSLAGRVPDTVLAATSRGFQGADWYGRMDQAEARTMFEEVSASRLAGELLDLGRIRRAIESWPSFGDTSPGELFGFGRHLTNALADGLFLAEFERYPPGR
jgi:asparagine synthase (glutamine-hydrolysing)